MNKAELVEALSKETKMTKTACENWLNAFTATVSKTIKREEVRLVGFGTWKSVKRKARTGRNPQTGRTIKIPARKVPVWRPGKDLKNKVR